MRAELKILVDRKVLDVLPDEGFPTVQVTLTAIPWCIPHDRQAVEREHGLSPDECWQVVWASEGYEYELCRISTGGPDHEWWRIT